MFLGRIEKKEQFWSRCPLARQTECRACTPGSRWPQSAPGHSATIPSFLPHLHAALNVTQPARLAIPSPPCSTPLLQNLRFVMALPPSLSSLKSQFSLSTSIALKWLLHLLFSIDHCSLYWYFLIIQQISSYWVLWGTRHYISFMLRMQQCVCTKVRIPVPPGAFGLVENGKWNEHQNIHLFASFVKCYKIKTATYLETKWQQDLVCRLWMAFLQNKS